MVRQVNREKEFKMYVIVLPLICFLGCSLLATVEDRFSVMGWAGHDKGRSWSGVEWEG